MIVYQTTTITEHVSADDRTRWDSSANAASSHAANASIHVPTPPKTGNYYLASDLTWKRAAPITFT